ncbi:helix-turn-helix domain-containing protein [Streptomyces sp. ISL-10]|uniref:helix-turn-helix domain-containing protein n=1 Tax=Streptomyces sp. ISL-10 TaxID=2819172 RepID=UPI0020351201|nr:helix-turn-helix domain-containing protein [Streptomyces sp. ISL-10]
MGPSPIAHKVDHDVTLSRGTHAEQLPRGLLNRLWVCFERGEKNGEIAAELRVSERSVERWRRAWRERAHVGVRSKGSPGRPKLREGQVARLERELERGPLAHGGRISGGRRGCTPVVRVRGRAFGRVSMVGMTCYQPVNDLGCSMRSGSTPGARSSRRASAGATCVT